MKEADFMRWCMKRATDLGARLFRNNVGQAWVGQAEEFRRATTVSVQPGDVLIRQGRPFKAGTAGMSDLIGFVPVTVTQDMVGQKVAIYAAVETKSARGRATDEQKQFIAMVERFGGRAGIVRTDQDLTSILLPETSLAQHVAKKETGGNASAS